jgi:peptidoglycan hydrolase CwlO-like protein
MKKSAIYLLFVLAITSCDSVTSKLEEKQRMLEGKVNQLDSVVNSEVSKVMQLDTLIAKEKAALDSLLNIEERLLGK